MDIEETPMVESSLENIHVEESFDELSISQDITHLNELINNNLVHDHAEDLLFINDCIRKDNDLAPGVKQKEFFDYDLPDEIKLGIRSLGLRVPSLIQNTILEEIFQNTETPLKFIAQGRSGTGKTIAYVLAALSKVQANNDKLQVICLAPTIELCKQIGEVFKNVINRCDNLNVATLCRGEDFSLISNSEIVVGTVGGIREIMESIDWSNVKCFIIDEADIMMATANHFETCMEIMEKVNENCSILMVSATVNTGLIEMVKAHPHCKDLKVFSIERPFSMKRDIQHFLSRCTSREHKLMTTIDLFSKITICKAIIFCKTRASAYYIQNVFESNGAGNVAVMTGLNDVAERAEIVRRFKAGDHRLLVTTNILARGVDITGLNLVINYDVPKLDKAQKFLDTDTYMHRAGRTARYNKKGIVVTFIDTDEEMAMIKELETSYDITFKLLDVDTCLE